MSDTTVRLSQLLSVTNVAKTLDCSRGHVYGLIAAGKLSAVEIHTSGRPKTRVYASEVEAFIARNTRRISA